jgi:hypothetical protein
MTFREISPAALVPDYHVFEIDNKKADLMKLFIGHLVL